MGVVGNHLISLEFEDTGSVLVRGLLDGAGCFMEEGLSVRQLGGEAGQNLPDRWETVICDHQLLLQLADTPQHWKHNKTRVIALSSLVSRLTDSGLTTVCCSTGHLLSVVK